MRVAEPLAGDEPAVGRDPRRDVEHSPASHAVRSVAARGRALPAITAPHIHM
jgi:hypothetical protein